jgi:ribosomal protein S18 acetylase RimI-like enzyme
MIDASTATIRPATADDADRLSRFASRLFRETFAAQNTPQDMDAYLSSAFSAARQLSQINDAATLTLVAEIDGALVGYAQLRMGPPPPCVPDPQSIELVRLYVESALHGRGLARSLMHAAVAAASSRASSMWLGVWEHNPRAIAFYRKWGFVDVGSHMFQLGADRQIDRIMWCSNPLASAPPATPPESRQ